VRRVLITGGFGFLGGHLLELLLSCPGNHVHVADNLSSSPLPLDRLLAELPIGDFTYSIQDLKDPSNGLGHPNYDEIFHLASLVGPAGILPHSGQIASSILGDALRMAEVAIECGARLVFVSSSEVYGGGADGYCREEMPGRVSAAVSARAEYAAGKLAAEIALLNLSRTRGLDVRVVRPFNVAGPRQSGTGGFVLPRFVGMALASVPITVFGDGTQRRAFTDVRDIAAGLLCVSRSGKSGQVYNLGNLDNLCTILDLAHEVKEITGSASEIRPVDGRSIYGPFYEEAQEKIPDATRARDELGWHPRIPRRQTVIDSVAYMRALPEEILHRLRGF
jgi:nucleoside-diphosphate-sugar epimerase